MANLPTALSNTRAPLVGEQVVNQIGHRGKPSPKWETVQHRYPEPGPGSHLSAIRVVQHVRQTIQVMLGSLDRVRSDLTLSGLGRGNEIEKIGATAVAALALLDAPAAAIGNHVVVLQLHFDEAEARVLARIKPADGRIPYLTSIADQLSRLDRPTILRALAEAEAALSSDAPGADVRVVSAITTAQGVQLMPTWAVSPAIPLDTLLSLRAALRRRLAPAENEAAEALALALDHVAFVRANATSALLEAGYVVDQSVLVAS